MTAPGRGSPTVAAAAALILALFPGPAGAQEVTIADYGRAEQFLPGNVSRFITGLPRLPVTWVGESDRFWYQVRTDEGNRFVLVDPEAGARRDAFDHARLASALSMAADTTYDPTTLPFESFRFSADMGAVDLEVGTRKWRCTLSAYSCSERDAASEASPSELASPTGDQAIYRQGDDLWLKALGDTAGAPLTQDGEPYFDYGTSPEGSTSAVTVRRSGRTPAPIALWSPDGRYVATHQLDQRGVGDMHLVQGAPEDGAKRPRHFSYRYALPGDSVVPMAQLVVADTETGDVIRLKAEPLVSIIAAPISFQQLWWSPDASSLYFLRVARDQRKVTLEVANPVTGEVRPVLEESCSTHCDVHPSIGGRPNVRVLASGEVLWWSERDGWGHLYLYDEASGSLKRQVTDGPWLVRDVLHVDELARVVWFVASGRESGDPYYQDLYRVGLDGGPVTRLTFEETHHLVTASPSGRYFVDVHGQIDGPQHTVVRDRSGEVLLTVEETDFTLLERQGWKAPERVVTKARDGTTDLYGLIVKPSGFDPEARYPVIEYVYPGPQTNWVAKSIADPLARGLWDAQATAELGAVVVLLDGMGTPMRSKSFHDVSYGKLEDAGGLADHVSGLKQLAATRPYMDLDRVGIYGFSGGGFMSTHAILTQPDMYKVAVSGAGNHDQRGYIALWGEKYHGLLASDGANYVQQANLTHAANLEGKLLLIHGEMDDNVSPALTMQLVDALIKANRSFDMLVLPNLNHATTGSDPYYIRRRWDYFVEHLLERQPPENYQIVPS